MGNIFNPNKIVNSIVDEIITEVNSNGELFVEIPLNDEKGGDIIDDS